jgi:hypothetical protein
MEYINKKALHASGLAGRKKTEIQGEFEAPYRAAGIILPPLGAMAARTTTRAAGTPVTLAGSDWEAARSVRTKHLILLKAY